MNVLIISIACGVIAGILYEAGYLVRATAKFSIFCTIIVDSIVSLIIGALFCLCILAFNFGEFRIYILLGYLFGFAICLISIGKIVAKLVDIIYNYIERLKKCSTNRKKIKGIPNEQHKAN